MRSLSCLRPKGHFDHVAWELVLFIALGVALAVGTTVAVAWAAGFGDVMHRLAQPLLIEKWELEKLDSDGGSS